MIARRGRRLSLPHIWKASTSTPWNPPLPRGSLTQCGERPNSCGANCSIDMTIAAAVSSQKYWQRSGCTSKTYIASRNSDVIFELALRPEPQDEPGTTETPEFASSAAIEQTYFVVPVRLCIDGHELLIYPGVHPAWRPLPVLGFATRLRRVLITLEPRRSEAITLADGGSLEIYRDEDNLILTTSLAPLRANAPREELVAAAVHFSSEACDYARSVSPTISAHPFWSTWCPEPD